MSKMTRREAVGLIALTVIIVSLLLATQCRRTVSDASLPQSTECPLDTVAALTDTLQPQPEAKPKERKRKAASRRKQKDAGKPRSMLDEPVN